MPDKQEYVLSLTESEIVALIDGLKMNYDEGCEDDRDSRNSFLKKVRAANVPVEIPSYFND